MVGVCAKAAGQQWVVDCQRRTGSAVVGRDAGSRGNDLVRALYLPHSRFGEVGPSGKRRPEGPGSGPVGSVFFVPFSATNLTPPSPTTMNVLKSMRDYVSKMVSDTQGMKVLLLDGDTVWRARGRDGRWPFVLTDALDSNVKRRRP